MDWVGLEGLKDTSRFRGTVSYFHVAERFCLPHRAEAKFSARLRRRLSAIGFRLISSFRVRGPRTMDSGTRGPAGSEAGELFSCDEFPPRMPPSTMARMLCKLRLSLVEELRPHRSRRRHRSQRSHRLRRFMVVVGQHFTFLLIVV